MINKVIENRNIVIVIGLLLLMAINSSYCLWQINRHEKALLGQEWLNPVPYEEWNLYEKRQAEYEKTAKFYNDNNQQLIAFISQVNKKILSESKNKLITQPFSVYQAMTDPFYDFYMDKAAQNEFSKQYPEEYKTWQAIVYDLNSKRPSSVPKPSNPSKAVIQQQINSYNRYLVFSDAFLGMALISFLVIYHKAKP